MRVTPALIATLALFSNVAAIGQGAAPPAKPEKSTEIEQFIAKRGSVFVKDIYAAGQIDGQFGDSIKLQLIVLSDPTLPAVKPTYGIVFDHVDKDGNENNDYLDYDECQELSNALAYELKLAARMSPEHHENTEVHYRTEDLTDFGFVQASGQQTAFVMVAGENVFLTMDNFQALKAAIDQAIAQLQQKGAIASTASSGKAPLRNRRSHRAQSRAIETPPSAKRPGIVI